MKKIMAGFVTFVMVFSLTACGDSQAQTAPDTQSEIAADLVQQQWSCNIRDIVITQRMIHQLMYALELRTELPVGRPWNGEYRHWTHWEYPQNFMCTKGWDMGLALALER